MKSVVGTVVDDPLPLGVTFQSIITISNGTVVTPAIGANGTVAWTIGSLSAGASDTLEFEVEAMLAGYVSNTAILSADNFPGGSATTTVDVLAATPLPAALPLFATGIAGLGLLGWRKKRKAQAVA